MAILIAIESSSQTYERIVVGASGRRRDAPPSDDECV
jgi:hypothetical protein